MIPLKDENPKKNLPFINFIFIIANLAVFIYQPSSEQYLREFFQTFGLIPNKLITLLQYGMPQTLLIIQSLFSSLFVHAGFMHLAGNMLFLWVFGDNIEYTIGHVNYILFYLLCGVVATLVQVFIEPNSTIPIIGASGAVSGILGAYIIKFPKNKVTTLFIIIIFIKIVKIRAIYLLGIWFIYQLLQGYFSLGQESMGGVAWFAHIGGFISGIILVNIFKKRPNR
ncbi:MAG: rhomboid family intramembrane serine protease [Calditrichia bacterium]|nr:rhomboid family intramembrane serine protease [Calditrichia bacterium]